MSEEPWYQIITSEHPEYIAILDAVPDLIQNMMFSLSKRGHVPHREMVEQAVERALQVGDVLVPVQAGGVVGLFYSSKLWWSTDTYCMDQGIARYKKCSLHVSFQGFAMYAKTVADYLVFGTMGAILNEAQYCDFLDRQGYIRGGTEYVMKL